jgi:hypothetical protein
MGTEAPLLSWSMLKTENLTVSLLLTGTLVPQKFPQIKVDLNSVLLAHVDTGFSLCGYTGSKVSV